MGSLGVLVARFTIYELLSVTCFATGDAGTFLNR